ncbi:hypothetical protein F5146DRAFT_1129226 [Armillaria mellea]|nr:hypothetical protein F5146DRAFT_1129226 [Armillaria mellea]
MICHPPSPSTSSNSSSDDSEIMLSSSMQHIIPSTSKIPVCFTDGLVLLDLLEDYSEHCEIYLCEYHEKVAPNAVLPKLISGIECKVLHNAYLLNHTSYDGMTLNNFLNILCQHSFGPDWAINQAQKIKAMKQDGLPMNQWFVNVFAACHILIKAGIVKADDGETFAKWCALINKMDQQICQNNVHLLELVCMKIPSFSQPQSDFQSNSNTSAFQQWSFHSGSSSASLPLFTSNFTTQNAGFVNAIVAQQHKLSSEKLFTLAKLTHGCLKCLMLFQNHISHSGLCDAPALMPGMQGYQPCNIKWVNEWSSLNPAGFKNRNAGAPAAPACVSYTITPDTIHHGIEHAQGHGHQVPLCFLANNVSMTSRTPVVHINLSQLPLPTNYAAPIMHHHDFPPCALSCAAKMPEFSSTSVVSFSDDSLDESDHDHHSPPHCHNT